MEPAPRTFRMEWMDYARLICALWVVLEHYCVVALDPRINPAIESYGALTTLSAYAMTALYFFFMASGLVITLTAQRHSASEFAIGRLVRIIPTFVICMTLTALLTQHRPIHPLQGVGQYLANLTFFPQIFGYRFIDAVYWMLGIEITFYLFIFLVIATGQTKRLPQILAIWIVAQVVCLPLGGPWPLVSPNYHFLAAGAAMALHYRGDDRRVTLPLLGVSLGLCLHTSHAHARQMHTDALIQMALVVLLFLFFALMRRRQIKLPFAHRIGSLTYPLYLLHFQLGLAMIHRFGTASNSWALLAALCAGFIAVSLVLDDIIEFRLRWLWKRLFGGAVEWVADRFRTRGSRVPVVDASIP